MHLLTKFISIVTIIYSTIPRNNCQNNFKQPIRIQFVSHAAILLINKNTKDSLRLSNCILKTS